MANQSQSRREIGFVIAMVLGLVLGVFIKRVQIGLLIGLVLGLLAAGSRKLHQDDSWFLGLLAAGSGKRYLYPWYTESALNASGKFVVRVIPPRNWSDSSFLCRSVRLQRN